MGSLRPTRGPGQHRSAAPACPPLPLHPPSQALQVSQAGRACLELHSRVIPLGGGRGAPRSLGPSCAMTSCLSPFLGPGPHPQGDSLGCGEPPT